MQPALPEAMQQRYAGRPQASLGETAALVIALGHGACTAPQSLR